MIYRLQQKEAKSPNKFAQANAKHLAEFLQFSKKVYIRMLHLEKQCAILGKLHDSMAVEMIAGEAEKEKEIIRDMWGKYADNPEVKASLKQWADIIVQQVKLSENGSKRI